MGYGHHRCCFGVRYLKKKHAYLSREQHAIYKLKHKKNMFILSMKLQKYISLSTDKRCQLSLKNCVFLVQWLTSRKKLCTLLYHLKVTSATTQHASQSFLMFIFLEFVMRQYPPKIAHSPTWLAKVMKGR